MQKSKRFLALTLAATLLLAFGMGIYMGRNTPILTEALAEEMQLKATKEDSAGVDLDTEFVLSSESPINIDHIRNNLTVEPSINFSVKRPAGKNNELLIVPEEPLEPNKIYKFTLDTISPNSLKWAFQTKGEFRIVSTLPRNQSSGVPVDTGIEITFSHLNFENLPEYFSISPETPGSFEVHKKTAVFIPDRLEPETLYTVTIKKGLPLAGSSQVLEEDVTFQFETQAEPTSYSFRFFKTNSEFSTKDRPLLQFNFFSWGDKALPHEIEFTVYNYKSAEDFIKAQQERETIPIWAYRSREIYIEDTSKLQQVARFLAPVMEYDYSTFVEFPEPLPAGYYLAEINFDGIKSQTWFQVTDLSLYSAVDKEYTYIWVNNLQDGSPASGARVELYGSDEAAVTDASGLVRLATPQDTSTGIYGVVSKDSLEAVITIPPWYQWDSSWEKSREFAMGYWKYLYLDRSLYKPDDTVYFWGILKPRTEDAGVIDKVTAVLSTGGWRENSDIESIEVKLDDFSFTGSMKLPNLTPGYYDLEIRVGDKTVDSAGFEVQTYSKPAYNIEVKPSKKAVYIGDKVDFEIKASFFEGTPAAFLPIQTHIDGPGQNTVTTDEEGNAILSYVPVFSKEVFSSILYKRLFLTAKLPEAGEITAESLVRVLNNDIDIDVSNKVEGNTATLEIQLDKLTVDKVNSGQYEPWDRDAYKDGPVGNHPVKIEVFREVWERREEGKYYDFINKKVETRYYYEYKKLPYSEAQVTTNSAGKAVYSFPVEDRQSYLVRISAQDFRGNPAVRERQVLGPGFYREYNYKWYNLEGKTVYKAGEEVNLVMKENELQLPTRAQGYLFLMSRKGIQKAYVQDSPEFKTVFDEELIPNFWIRGIYFDGKNYHETYDSLVTYDYGERALKIDIKTDKDEYRPQETVNVEVKVTDKQGKPVKAVVNLNLVDEALYALQDQHVDILRAIYSDTFDSGIKTSFYTHEIPDMPPGGAEHGGEGGSERKDFRDAVLFKTLTTDNKGRAQIYFRVPDNLTTWRLTCQAVTKDLWAATKTAPVVVKLPFFVDMVVNDTYLSQDRPLIPLRAFGDQLKAGTSVTYEVALEKDGKTIKDTIPGKAFTMTFWQLPPLESGKYSITVTGKTPDGLRDRLTLSFKVVDSFLSKRQVDFRLLEENLKIKGSEDTLTSLTFTDYQRSQYLNSLLQLQWAQGSRIDQKIAWIMGGKLLDEYFPGTVLNDIESGEIDFLKYQTAEGGIALLPYSSAELELSAKLAALLDDAFDKAALADYLFKVAGDPRETRERSIMAFYGLAALGEPVLTELKLLSQQENLTAIEKLYLALAFVEVGDEPSAAGLIKSLIKEKGEDLGHQMRIKVGQDQDDILQATALAAVAASGLNLEEQSKLYAYVLENSRKDILLYIEQLLFLNNALTRLPEKPVSFSYSLEGRQERVTLKPGETYRLILTQEKLETLKFGDIEGQVGVTAVYDAAFDPSLESSSDEVKLSKSYGADGITKNTFDAHDIITITLSYEFGPTAPDGPYIITDFLPAGLKIIKRPYYHGVKQNAAYPLLIDGQKVTFGVYEKKSWSITYYARVINPGEFKAEPAIIQNLKSGKIYSITKEERIQIK
ncbi:Ig-like domain-containing protein [Tepidanaerobacter sp. GT38]|nr:Ig-like domain-containing protein [Tepidanaerobacter sp. GT38]